MEFAIKSKEISHSPHIRPLSDAEIDHVNGGVSLGSSFWAKVAEYLANRVIPH